MSNAEGLRTPTRIRLVHKVLDGRFHVYTSPDMRGLHIAADTQAEAQRQAVSVVHAIAEELGQVTPAIDFSELADAA